MKSRFLFYEYIQSPVLLNVNNHGTVAHILHLTSSFAYNTARPLSITFTFIAAFSTWVSSGAVKSIHWIKYEIQHKPSIRTRRLNPSNVSKLIDVNYQADYCIYYISFIFLTISSLRNPNFSSETMIISNCRNEIRGQRHYFVLLLLQQGTEEGIEEVKRRM